MPDIVEDPELRSGRAPPPHSGQARWLCCALLTYRPGYSSSLAPRQRALGPATKCESISVRALSSCRPAGGGIRYRIYEITYLARNLVKVPA